MVTFHWSKLLFCCGDGYFVEETGKRFILHMVMVLW